MPGSVTKPERPEPKRGGPEGIRERFPETSWTLLAKARAPDGEGARAREDFAKRYYQPVREFLLVLVHDADKADDLAQEFFTKLSGSRGVLDHADRERGSFRKYLQQALRHLVTDYHRRNRKQARETYPDQADAGGGWDVLELSRLPAAEAAFHHEWVKATLAEALRQVRAVCLKRRQKMHLQLFEARYLCEAEVTPSWSELGASYGMDQKTARERADTAVRHFRMVLRRMLRNDIVAPACGGVVTEAMIDEEISALLAPLRD